MSIGSGCREWTSRHDAQDDTDNLVGSRTVAPVVNQVLAHIINTPTELIVYSRHKGMLVHAYAPIVHGELVRNTQLAEIARNYGVDAARRNPPGLLASLGRFT